MTYARAPRQLADNAVSALNLAAHGVFWAGTKRAATEVGTLARGQASVEYFVPRNLSSDLPLVLVHGGGQGVDFMTRVDGGPGWLHHFVSSGRAVYVVDLPGHGRSPGHALQVGDTAPPLTYEMAHALFVAPEAEKNSWPGAQWHTPWASEEAIDAFVASSGPLRVDLASTQRDGAEALVAVLDQIGRAVLVTHSGGGPIGWLVADARPELVAAIVAVEPLGPPVVGMGPMTLPWGVTASPITYDPPAPTSEDLKFAEGPEIAPGAPRCLLQQDPPRSLPRLQRIPVAVVAAEASFMALSNYGVAAFLRQAGVSAEVLALTDKGVRGNGHLVMIEANNAESAQAVLNWLAQIN